MPAKKKVFLSPDQEARLRAAYEGQRSGMVVRLAREWGIPDTTLSYYAKHRLGLPPLLKYAPHHPWTDLELEILERYPNATNERMAWRLQKLTGRRRTPKAVEVQRSRLALSQLQPGDDENLSVNLIAAGLGLNCQPVYRWVETGILPAHRKNRNGRWCVKHDDLKAFLLHRDNWRRWHVKKADHMFLMDLFGGGTAIGAIQHSEGRADCGIAVHHLVLAEAA